jgi:hypothetical protein
MPTFGDWNGDPVAWEPGEAWVFRNANWERANPGDVGNNGRVLNAEAFKFRFPGVPDLPSNSFRLQTAACAKAPRQFGSHFPALSENGTTARNQ